MPADQTALLFRGNADDGREASADDAYAAALAAAGIDATSVAVLRFENCNLDAVANLLLDDPNRWEGIVLTSQRAAAALGAAAALRCDPLGNSRQRTMPVYVVGRATLQAVQHVRERLPFSVDCFGEDCGDAKELAALVLQRYAGRAARLLFLCGEQRMPTLESAITEHNKASDPRCSIELEHVVVYRSLPLERIELPCSCTEEQRRWFVFFSPSGWNAILSQHGTLLADRSHGIRLAAIGQTTAAAIRQSGFAVDAVARKPTPQALAEALTNNRADGGSLHV